jgi:glycyl-tRNA synthetase beta chain
MMPALFLELFSEEIPARMQARAADDLAHLMAKALSGLDPSSVRTWHGPRRLAYAAEVQPQIKAIETTERGPRTNAVERALEGFLRKHDATRDQLRRDGDYWVLEKKSAAVSAPALVAAALPNVLRSMPWPKSMRWGGTSHFVWIRPLRRIVCLLDGVVVPFDLRDGDDDGHGLVAGNLTEGHRFHAPAPFVVTSADAWTRELCNRRVLAAASDREQAIKAGFATLAAARGITVVDDPGLLTEVAGLVEWPIPLAGRIATEHLDLPPEVMRVSMRVNQRYFATRAADGNTAPWFLFVANVAADDGGTAIIAGNERVLRARFADARHFWDLDRKARLESRVPSLDHVTFHARLGTQGARVPRLRRLSAAIAHEIGAGVALADRAAELAKADLVTGMVGEFPELQGVMGRYYALHDHEDAYVADAIRDHYAPRGPSDPVPAAPVSVAVALADKLDQLACFFSIGERPTGAGDPYALRRAALGVIRIIRENEIRLSLFPLLDMAIAAAREAAGQTERPGTRPVPGTSLHFDALAFDVLEFLAERLRVQLRGEGARHDVLAAVFAAGHDDDITRLLARTAAVARLLREPDGMNLLAAYRRAANILRIEERKDGPHSDPPETGLLVEPAELTLCHALRAGASIADRVRAEDYAGAMAEMAKLRAPLDAFFEAVTVNVADPLTRRNRLRLLNQVRATMDRVADFSRIEG